MPGFQLCLVLLFFPIFVIILQHSFLWYMKINSMYDIIDRISCTINIHFSTFFINGSIHISLTAKKTKDHNHTIMCMLFYHQVINFVWGFHCLISFFMKEYVNKMMKWKKKLTVFFMYFYVLLKLFITSCLKE
jgi:hypothetical protein